MLLTRFEYSLLLLLLLILLLLQQVDYFAYTVLFFNCFIQIRIPIMSNLKVAALFTP